MRIGGIQGNKIWVSNKPGTGFIPGKSRPSRALLRLERMESKESSATGPSYFYFYFHFIFIVLFCFGEKTRKKKGERNEGIVLLEYAPE